MIISIRSSWLKVFSSIFTNIGTGMLLGLFTIRDIRILTSALLIAILCILTSVKIPEFYLESERSVRCLLKISNGV